MVRSCGLVLAVAVVAYLASNTAHAQITAVVLTPAGSSASRAFACGGGQQAGHKIDEIGQLHAGLWTGTAASWVDLHPAARDYSEALGARGGQQVGYTFHLSLKRFEFSACLWNGSAESVVYLVPSGSYDSYAQATDGLQQVGMTRFAKGDAHAALWTGSAASFVDLNPSGFAGSWAFGVGDGQQVGNAYALGSYEVAFLWSGSAASGLNLHPAGAFESAAYGVSRGRQVGFANIGTGQHAALWSGTAASFVDLNPSSASRSVANAVHDGVQVGSATLILRDEAHAVVWFGSANSFIDLHGYLPPGFVHSEATGVSQHEGQIQVSGFASTPFASSVAVLWTLPDIRPGPWTFTNLNPVGCSFSIGYGTDGERHVGIAELNGERPVVWTGFDAARTELCSQPYCGQVYDTEYGSLVGRTGSGGAHAALWQTSTEPPIDLHPPGASYSVARGIGDGQQAGEAGFGNIPRAYVWSGSAASGINLHPPGVDQSSAQDADRGVQVGYTRTGSISRAALWSGSAASYVDLHPAGADQSVAQAIDNGVQGGYIQVGALSRAALWQGSAQSHLDMHPPWASASVIYDIHNGEQCGTITVGGLQRATLWAGSANTAYDLHAFLPSRFATSFAFAMWSDENYRYIIGAAEDAVTGNAEAVRWSQRTSNCLAISLQPADVEACTTANVAFYLTTAGDGGETYVWRKNGTPIDTMLNPTAATATLALVNIDTFSAGAYDCVVSSPCRTVTSRAALLTVRTADFNCDGSVGSQDFFDFVASFFTGNADINGDGETTSQDFFDFLVAFFGG